MIDLQLLRQNPDVVRASQRARGDDESVVSTVLDLDARRRAALTDFEQLRASRSRPKLVASAQGEAKAEALARAKALAAQVKAREAEATGLAAELDAAVMTIGNVVIDGVPAGGEDDYVVLKTVGELPDLVAELGREPRDHLELGEGLGAIDTERGAKVSGARFYYLTGIGARLELALLNAAMAPRWPTVSRR